MRIRYLKTCSLTTDWGTQGEPKCPHLSLINAYMISPRGARHVTRTENKQLHFHKNSPTEHIHGRHKLLLRCKIFNHDCHISLIKNSAFKTLRCPVTLKPWGGSNYHCRWLQRGLNRAPSDSRTPLQEFIWTC